MKVLGSEPQIYLNAFMKTAQYLASLTTHEDAWLHIREVMASFYGATLSGFAARGPDSEPAYHHLILPDGISRDVIETKDFQETVIEVLETGFLGQCVIRAQIPHITVFLPITIANETAAVLLVGHAGEGPVCPDLLNVYLAVAGLAGTTITRLNSERDLKAYARKLESLNAELQEFAFVASHDLQEPLRKIQTFGHMVATKFTDALGTEGSDYLMRMTRAADRMSELLRSLLNYSRIATHPNPFDSTSLVKVVQDAVSDLELVIKQANGRIEVGELPVIDADAAQLRQVFQNLIGNSMKYRKESEQPVVKIYSTVSDGVCRLFVEDNGIGFDDKYADRIFRPFQRLHGRSSRYDGTGMGLAICRKIVERHGGSITARSVPGNGATFIVRIPAIKTEMKGF